MTKKYQLLLHIGLAKTATTSFQSNVCMPLHQEGRINYLGVVREMDKIEHYPFSDIFNKITGKKPLTTNEIIHLREQTNALLVEDKLNVLSEEQLSYSTLYDLDLLFANLGQIFSDCSVHCMLSLRLPTELVFSRYVQHYYLREQHSNFKAFAKHLLANPNSKEHIEFFYQDLLPLIDKHFARKTLLLFEDLTHDQPHYFSVLADLLAINADEVKKKFLANKKNTAKKTGSGKKGNPRMLAFILSNFFSELLLKAPILKNRAPLQYANRWALSLTKNIKISTKYNYPNKALSVKLSDLFNIKNVEDFSKQHNLSKSKLIQYGYAKNDTL